MAVTSSYRKKFEKEEVKRLSKEVGTLFDVYVDLLTVLVGGKEARARRLQIWACQGPHG